MSQDSKMTIRDGSKYWENDRGEYHRLDGPAAINADGTREWYVNGNRHRLDGPAIERVNGSKEWFVNGKRHRLNGPAIERTDGSCEWWNNGQKIPQEKFLTLQKILSRKKGVTI